jgi:hypothetical protein
VTDAQFQEMMQCLNGISAQLQTIHKAIEEVSGGYSIRELHSALGSVENAVGMVEGAVSSLD